MSRNCGTMRDTMMPRMIISSGRLTASSHDNPRSCRIAMNTPKTTIIGAATTIVHVMRTSICTCCTSFVMRVISDGAPKRFTSLAENATTRWKSAARTSRPKPIAALDAQ